MKTKQEVLRIVAKARAGLEKIYGDRLRGVYLFGSWARGEGDEDSDIDIAIVLDEIPDYFAEHERVSWLGSQLSLEADDLVSFCFMTDADLRMGSRAIHRAVMRQGVLV